MRPWALGCHLPNTKRCLGPVFMHLVCCSGFTMPHGAAPADKKTRGNRGIMDMALPVHAHVRHACANVSMSVGNRM